MNVELPETLVIIESVVYKSNGFAIDNCKAGKKDPSNYRSTPDKLRVSPFLGQQTLD